MLGRGRGVERLHGHHERKKLLKDNAIATVASMLAGLLMFGLQSFAGHKLHPSEFGRAFALIGFYSIVVRPSASFGRLVAWQTSREDPDDQGRRPLSDAVLRTLLIWTFCAGLVIALSSTAFSGALSHYFHTTEAEVVAIAWSSPFLLSVQLMFGSLQGERKFGLWSTMIVLLPISYLAFIAFLVGPLGTNGVLIGVSIGASITFAVGFGIIRRRLTVHPVRSVKPNWKDYRPFLVTGFISTLTVGVFVSADVVVVQHYFSRTIAGQYATVSAIGNALFSVSAGVASAIFPSVASRQAKGQRTGSIMFAVIALFVTITLIGTTTLNLLGSFALRNFAGAKYEGASYYLGWYAFGMGILSIAVVLVHTQQSRNRFGLLWILVPAFVLRPTLLILFHSSVIMVVAVSDLAVTLFAAALLIAYLVDERRMGVSGNLSAETRGRHFSQSEGSDIFNGQLGVTHAFENPSVD